MILICVTLNEVNIINTWCIHMSEAVTAKFDDDDLNSVQGIALWGTYIHTHTHTVSVIFLKHPKSHKTDLFY